jgi:hypothetical protein
MGTQRIEYDVNRPYRNRQQLEETTLQEEIREILNDDTIIVQSSKPYYTFTKQGVLHLKHYPALVKMGVKTEYQEVTGRTDCFLPQPTRWIHVPYCVMWSRAIIYIVLFLTTIRLGLAYLTR